MTGGTALDWLRNHGPVVLLVACFGGKRRRMLYLNGLGIKLQTLLLVCEKLLDILALISLKLNHLSHLSIDDNSAIASCDLVSLCADSRKAAILSWQPDGSHTELFLNDLKDFLLIEFLGKTLDCS